MSKTTNEKTTIYLDPRVKKNVRYYAVRDDKSLSEIINERLSEYLEDMEDIAAAKVARTDGDAPVPFERALEEMGISLDDIRSRDKTSSS